MAKKTLTGNDCQPDECVDVFAGHAIQPSGFPLGDTLVDRMPGDAKPTTQRPFGLRYATRPYQGPPLRLEEFAFDPHLQTAVVPGAPDPERAAIVRMGTARDTPPDGGTPTRPHDFQTD